MLITSVLAPTKNLLKSLPVNCDGVLINEFGLENAIRELQKIRDVNIKIERVYFENFLSNIRANHIVQNQYHISSSLMFQIALG